MGLKRVSTLIAGGLATCYVLAWSACTILMNLGRSAAETSVKQMLSNAAGKTLLQLTAGNRFSAPARLKLEPISRTLGKIKSASYGPIICQVSGRPCIASITFRGDSSSAKVHFYFYGGLCLAVGTAPANSR
jgi:hypothetical protein